MPTIAQDPEIDDFLATRHNGKAPTEDPEIDAFLQSRKLAAVAPQPPPPPPPPPPFALSGFGGPVAAPSVAPPMPAPPPQPQPQPVPAPQFMPLPGQPPPVPTLGMNPQYPNRPSLPVQAPADFGIQAEEPPPLPRSGPTLVTPVAASAVPQGPIDDRPDWRKWTQQPLITPEDVNEFFPFLIGPFSVHKGLIKAGAAMTSPENAAIMAGTGGAGLAAEAAGGATAASWRAISAGLSAYFGTQAGQALLEKYPQMKASVAKGDWQTTLELGGGALADAAMVVASTLHAGGEVGNARHAAGEAIDRHNAAAADLVNADARAGMEKIPVADQERKVLRGAPQATRRAEVPPLPENGSDQEARVQADRDHLASAYLGKPYAEASDTERAQIEQMILADEGPASGKPPAGNPAARRPAPEPEPVKGDADQQYWTETFNKNLEDATHEKPNWRTKSQRRAEAQRRTVEALGEYPATPEPTSPSPIAEPAAAPGDGAAPVGAAPAGGEPAAPARPPAPPPEAPRPGGDWGNFTTDEIHSYVKQLKSGQFGGPDLTSDEIASAEAEIARRGKGKPQAPPVSSPASLEEPPASSPASLEEPPASSPASLEESPASPHSGEAPPAPEPPIAEPEVQPPPPPPPPAPEPQPEVPPPPANPAAQPRSKGQAAIDRSTMARINRSLNDPNTPIEEIEKSLGQIPEGQFPQIRRRLEATRDALRAKIGTETTTAPPEEPAAQGSAANPDQMSDAELEKATAPEVKAEPKVPAGPEPAKAPVENRPALERGMAVELKVDDKWEPAEIEEVKSSTTGEPLYEVSRQSPRDPADKVFARVAADQLRVPEFPKVGSPEAEADFQRRYSEGIAQTRKRAMIDVDEGAVLRDIHKFATEGDGAVMGDPNKGRTAILHRVTETVKIGRKNEQVTKWRAVASDPRQGTIHEDFKNPVDAAEWAANIVHSIGRPREDFKSYFYGGSDYTARNLTKRGTLLKNSDTGFAAADAAARAIGKPGLTNDIYMGAFGGGTYGAKEGMTLAEIAGKYADSLPANDGFVLDRIKEKNYGSGMEDEHRQLLRPADTPPTIGHSWKWERMQEDFERAAKGMLENTIPPAERRIATAKELNGGETSPRIEKAEQVVADTKAAIERNLAYVKDQAKSEIEKEIGELEPKAREFAQAYAKFGDAAFSEEQTGSRNDYHPNAVLDRYSKLREIKGGWPGLMEHFGIEAEPRPARVAVPLNGPGRLLKGEVEALKTADLAGGTLRPGDTGTVIKLEKRGWIKPDTYELTDAGKAAVYSYRTRLGELSKGLPMSEYAPGSGKIAPMGESRFSGWSNYDGDVWHTDGHGAWRGEYPPNWPPRDKAATNLPQLDRVIPKESGDAAKPIGFSVMKDGQTLVHFSDGGTVNQSLYDYTVKRYDPAKWTRIPSEKGNGYQAWDKDGKRVAILMPMRAEVPEGLKPKGNPAARSRGISGSVAVESAAEPTYTQTKMFPPGAPRAPGGVGPVVAPVQGPGRNPAAVKSPGRMLGIPDFLEKDVLPLGAKSIHAVKQTLDIVKGALAPETLSDKSLMMANRLRQGMGEQAHKRRMAYVAMEDAHDYFRGKDLHTEILPFYDAMEHGNRPQVGKTPEETRQLQAFADTMRDVLDQKREEVRALGTGKLEKFMTDFFPHIWKDPAAAKDIYKELVSRSGNLEGPKNFLHSRTIDSISDGVNLRGLTPAYDNPVDMVMAKLHEMDKYILGHQAVKWQKQMGLAKYVPVEYHSPKGMTTLDDPIFTVYGPNKFSLTEFHDKQLMDGLNKFANSLGMTHVHQMNLERGSAGTAGYTIKGSNKVWTKFATPEAVLAHEIGHQLEWKYNLSGKLKALKTPGLATEMRNLADLRIEGVPASAHYKKYIRNIDEKMANAVAALMYAPEKFKRTAPKLWDALRDEMHAIPELKPFFDLERSMVLGSNTMPMEMQGLRILGKYYMAPEVAQVYKNYLSPGLRGNDIFRAYLGAANSMNQFQLGFSAYHAGFTVLDSYMSKAALGIEQLSRGDFKGAAGSALRFATAPIENFVRGHRIIQGYDTGNPATPQLARDIRNVELSGGRASMDSIYATKAADKFVDALKAGKYPKAIVTAIPALADMAMKPIMEKMVPRMKMGALADLTRYENARLDKLDARWKQISDQHQTPQGYDLDAIANDPAMDRKGANEARRLQERIKKQYSTERLGVSDELARETYALAQNSIDNRMGEMVYDNKFMNRTVKDMLQASVRSLGWNMGTVLEHGGGAWDTATAIKRFKEGDPLVTHRMAYLFATPLVMGLAGAMMTKLATGDGPKEMKDYFFPRSGNTDEYGRPERWSLPSYMKEWAHLYYAAQDKDPGAIGKVVASKLHPAISALVQMLNNEDYYGTQIIDPDNIGASFVKGVAKQFVPFGVRGMQKESERGGSTASKILPFFGITPAPAFINKTRAERLIDKYSGGQASRLSEAPEQFERGRSMREITRSIRRGDEDRALDLGAEALNKGVVAKRDLDTAAKRAELSPLESAYQGLRDPMRAVDVMAVATPEERERLKPIFLKKMKALDNGATNIQNRVGDKIRKAGLTYLFD